MTDRRDRDGAGLTLVMLAFLAGCADPGRKIQGRPSADDSTADSTPTESADTHGDSQGSPDSTDSEDTSPAVSALQVPAGLRLPVVEIGAAGAAGILTLTSEVGSGPLAFRAGRDLAVEGDTDPLDPGEAREITVRYVGGTDDRQLFEGTITVTESGITHEVWVAAVVAHPDLPSTVSWEAAPYGEFFVADLPSAPFPYGGASWVDSSVLVHLPAPIRTSTVGAITHLHGHSAVLREVVADQHLLEQAALSGRDAVFIAPQGPYDYPSGDFGRLATAGGHEDLVQDVIAILYREGKVERVTPGDQVLTAHSGGYLGTAAILERGGLPIRAVHLFDAAYGELSTFQDFVRGGGILRSLYTASGGTDANNRAMRATLEGEGLSVGHGASDLDLRQHPINIAYTESDHFSAVDDTRNYARFLAASGLPPGRYGAPELLYARATAGQAEVRWLDDPSGALDAEIGGVGYAGTTAQIALSGAITAACVDNPCGTSDTYGATGDGWLIVDGYDRVLTGSWQQPTHDFAARVGAALAPEGFSTASNEAVAGGLVALGDYGGVIWLLGDESTADVTFDDEERAAIEGYLSGGGRLLVSGAEVGYATDGAWLSDALGVRYVSDDAGSLTAGGYTFGALYPEDYPDVLSGARTIWQYGSGGAAAVVGDVDTGAVVVVGFGIENIESADLPSALAELIAPL